MPEVVTCVVASEGKILILRRSDLVRTYRGQWGGVAGYVEPGEQPLQTAMKELHEETGLLPDQVALVVKGEPISFSDVYDGEKYDWVIHPFLFQMLKHIEPTIDWEHSEYRWVNPKELSTYKTVPHFTNTVQELWRKKRMGKRGGVVRKREEK
jgi:8-oxo-dGTP pyrophosphatase MutT (NUDIX family)